MMLKIMDYYYLVLLRHFDNWFGKEILSYYVPCIVSFTLTVNIYSFAILIDQHLVNNVYFWLSLGVVFTLVVIAVEIIYNKRHREKIREKHKGESRKSRKQGIIYVVFYVLFSILFFIGVIFLAAKR